MLVLGIFWLDVTKHFELVELVNAQNATGVAASRAGFAAVAGAPAGIAQRTLRQVDDFIAVVTGERNLAGASEIKVVGRQVINFVGVLTQETGAGHNLWANQSWGDQGGEVFFAG